MASGGAGASAAIAAGAAAVPGGSIVPLAKQVHLNTVTRLWKSQEAIRQQRIKSSSKGAVDEMAWVKMATGPATHHTIFSISYTDHSSTQMNTCIYF